MRFRACGRRTYAGRVVARLVRVTFHPLIVQEYTHGRIFTVLFSFPV